VLAQFAAAKLLPGRVDRGSGIRPEDPPAQRFVTSELSILIMVICFGPHMRPAPQVSFLWRLTPSHTT
jgi:hypothetical protein